MIIYHRQGNIPKRKHIATFDRNNKLIREELFSTKGFSGEYSTLYYSEPPVCLVENNKIIINNKPEIWGDAPFDYHHFDTFQLKSSGHFIEARVPMLTNSDCTIGLFSISKSTSVCFQNVSANELIFVHEGSGVMDSVFGRISFEKGDYIIIPKGVLYNLTCKNLKRNRFLYVESNSEFQIPKSYLNSSGQLLETAPYSERDFKLPVLKKTKQRKNKKFEVIVKRENNWYQQIHENDLMSAIGWDGYLYPFAINIEAFCPKVGKIHLPPPVHKIFENDSFVICNFVPRLLDFHDGAVTAPYYHMNIDSDEVLYYLDGNFLSRKGVSEGSLTLHPMGLTHGPQPGKQEESIGKKDTNELAVMIDTFKPLEICKNMVDCRKSEYTASWLTPKKSKKN